MAGIETLCSRMVYWCRDANMGYSQYDRWHFDPAGGNCDCSSLVIHCLQEAGFDTGTAGYTGNLSANLTSRGWIRLPCDGNPQRGDVLLNDSMHVAVYLGGGLLAQASISEYNTISGNPGDQTGGETNISHYYNYPWDCYLRWNGENMPSAQEIAEAVWNFNQNGTAMRDRVQGTDQAANAILKEYRSDADDRKWNGSRIYRTMLALKRLIGQDDGDMGTPAKPAARIELTDAQIDAIATKVVAEITATKK